MPQGWRPTHPGDPTPGPSKAGRLVIVIAVAVGVAIALMVIAVRPAGASDALVTPTMSQEPSPEPPPWFGGRVEMPEHGFALTLRAGWVAFDPGADVYEQARRVLETRSEDEVPHEAVLTVARLLDDVRQSERHIAVYTPSWSGCGVTVVPGVHIDLDVGADELHTLIASQNDVEEVGLPEVLELHAGPARLVRYSSTDGSKMGMYIGDGPDATFIFACGGESDEWLAIPEAFEFLSAEE